MEPKSISRLWLQPDSKQIQEDMRPDAVIGFVEDRARFQLHRLEKEKDLLDMFMDEFNGFKMPPEIAEWFRASIPTAFADVGELQRQRKQAMAKRKTVPAGISTGSPNGRS